MIALGNQVREWGIHVILWCIETQPYLPSTTLTTRKTLLVTATHFTRIMLTAHRTTRPLTDIFFHWRFLVEDRQNGTASSPADTLLTGNRLFMIDLNCTVTNLPLLSGPSNACVFKDIAPLIIVPATTVPTPAT